MRRALVLGLPFALSCCVISAPAHSGPRQFSRVEEISLKLGAASIEGSDETDLEAEAIFSRWKNERLKVSLGKLEGEFDTSKTLKLKVKMGAAEIEGVPNLELSLDMGAAEVSGLRWGQVRVRKGAAFLELADDFYGLELEADKGAAGILVPKGTRLRLEIEAEGSEVEVDEKVKDGGPDAPYLKVKAKDSKITVSSDQAQLREKVGVNIDID